MTRSIGQEREEGQLRAAVALPKWMDGIQLGEDVGCKPREFRGRATLQEIMLFEPGEEPRYFSGDVLGVAERARAFGQTHGAGQSAAYV